MPKNVGNANGKVPSAQGGTENQNNRRGTYVPSSLPIFPRWVAPANADFEFISADGYRFPVNLAFMMQKNPTLTAILLSQHCENPRAPEK